MTMQEVVVSQLVQVVVGRAQGMGRPAEEGLMSIEIGGKLKPERVQEWLIANPEWRLDASGKVLYRTRSFPTQGAAMHFASFVSGLAAAMALPALLEVRGVTVHLSLSSPRGRRRAPLTENVLALASQIG
jgi:pterin-4a-carbinolamine dehydratase